MNTTAPLVLAFVLLLAFLLMLMTFRSLVIAAKAVLLNLLSVAAAYGVLVLVFQYGWGKTLLGFEVTSGIDPFLPILLFVILFGLSMDYHVFILSRVRRATTTAPPLRPRSHTASRPPPASSPALPSSWSGCSPSSGRCRR